MAALLVGAGAVGAVALPGLAEAAPVPAPVLPAGCTQAANTVTCTYTAGTATFTAPAGVTALDVTLTGGHGGPGEQRFGLAGAQGGAGTSLTGRVTLGAASDRTFDVVVGANGTTPAGNIANSGGVGTGNGGIGGDGFDYGDGGGGGGGSSFASDDRTIIAGGGGGGGGGGPAGSGTTGQPSGPTTGSRNGGDGRAGLRAGSGGGGGGLQGGAAGTGGFDAGGPDGTFGGAGGYAGTSSAFGTASTSAAAGGSVVVSYVVADPTPPARLGGDLVATIDAPAALEPGEDGTVTVTVTNRGTGTATRVRSLVFIPRELRVTGVSGDIGSHTYGGNSYRFDEPGLAAGESRTYTFDVVALRLSPRVFVNARATSRTPDAFPRDNVDRAPVRVGPAR